MRDPGNNRCPSVDPSGKATRIDLFSLARPHMRTFHRTWFAFFLAFFSWFGIAPLMALVFAVRFSKQEQLAKRSAMQRALTPDSGRERGALPAPSAAD